MILTAQFFSSLFGCAKASDHGLWTSLAVSNVSPDRRDSYSFRVNVCENGEMILYGYCYDEEREYRSDAGIVLPVRVVDKLREMEIEKLPVKTPKRRFWKRAVVDTAERIAQAAYEDGADLELILLNEQREAITSLLGGVLIATVSAELRGEWDKLRLGFTSDNYSEGYDFEVYRNDAGVWIAKGYCSDEDYRRCESENGIFLASETVKAIRNMDLDRYAAVQKSETEVEGVMVLDGSCGGLTLGYADGYTAEKATPREVDHVISVLLKKEFAEKADKQ